MTFPCFGVELGSTVAALGQKGTIQGIFWISEPMHTFLKSSGIDKEQVLSRVRYEPTPQVFVQADQGLQSNSFFTETVSKKIFYCSTVRKTRTSATKFGEISKTRTISDWQQHQNPLFPTVKKIIRKVVNAWQGLNDLLKSGAKLREINFICRTVGVVILFSHLRLIATGFVFKRAKNAIHRINRYPIDQCWQDELS